jgi:hypothetical protein
MAAKLTRLIHKVTIQLHLLAETCTTCSSRSRRSVRKLLDTPYIWHFITCYMKKSFNKLCKLNLWLGMSKIKPTRIFLSLDLLYQISSTSIKYLRIWTMKNDRRRERYDVPIMCWFYVPSTNNAQYCFNVMVKFCVGSTVPLPDTQHT